MRFVSMFNQINDSLENENYPPLKYENFIKLMKGTYVSFKYRYVYIPVRKAACTTIKHIIHKLEGLPFIDPSADDFGSYYRDQSIHKRHLFRMPSFWDLNEGTVDEITHSNEWFVFSVYRNSVQRAVSYWQDKIITWEDFDTAKKIARYREEGSFITFQEFSDWIKTIDIVNEERHLWPNFSSMFCDEIENLQTWDIYEYTHWLSAFGEWVGFSFELTHPKNVSLSVCPEIDPRCISSIYRIDTINDLMAPFPSFKYEEYPNMGFLSMLVERNLSIHRFRKKLLEVTKSVKENY